MRTRSIRSGRTSTSGKRGPIYVLHNPDPTSPPRKSRHSTATVDAGEHIEHLGMPAARKVSSMMQRGLRWERHVYTQCGQPPFGGSLL